MEHEPTTAREVERGEPAGSAKVERNVPARRGGGQAREDEPDGGAEDELAHVEDEPTAVSAESWPAVTRKMNPLSRQSSSCLSVYD